MTPNGYGVELVTDEHGTWAPDMLAKHLRVAEEEARQIRLAFVAGMPWSDTEQRFRLRQRWALEALAARSLIEES